MYTNFLAQFIHFFSSVFICNMIVGPNEFPTKIQDTIRQQYFFIKESYSSNPRMYARRAPKISVKPQSSLWWFNISIWCNLASFLFNWLYVEVHFHIDWVQFSKTLLLTREHWSSQATSDILWPSNLIFTGLKISLYSRAPVWSQAERVWTEQSHTKPISFYDQPFKNFKSQFLKVVLDSITHFLKEKCKKMTLINKWININ